jgi:mannose-1-phosphate guanylyltransferase
MIYAVILAGGRGERFWPLSREAKPKQFLSDLAGLPAGRQGKKSFLRETFERIKPRFGSRRIYVVSQSFHKAKVKRILPELNKKNIIAEPLIKNTAASIGLAASFLLARDHEAVMVSLPVDHIIRKNKKFLDTISVGVKVAQRLDCLVAIGIKPRYAAVGYGYLKIISNDKHQISKIKKSKCKVYKVEKFIEKPDRITALKFLNTNYYLWNSGIFIFKASVILEAIKKYLPSLYFQLSKVNTCLPTGRIRSVSYKQILSKIYSHIKAVSLDYGVMEKAENIYAVLGDFFWDDIGSWLNLERVSSKDKAGNIIRGSHIGLETENSTIICEGEHLITTLGISDIIIIHTRDATLVCRKDRAKDIKKLIKKLDKRYL